jgi:ubiquinone biosynthesis monooxygenase Coq6
MADKLCKLTEKDFLRVLNAAFQNPVEDVMFALTNLDNPDIDIKTEMDWGKTRLESNHDSPPPISSISTGSRASFPLQLQHSKKYWNENIALVGDAAHSVHPLAGQGLNLGLADAEALSRLVISGIRNGQLVSDPEILSRYAAERFLPNSSVLLACDSLSRLFSNQNQFLSRFRSFGLNLLNQSSLSKTALMKLAS